MSNPPEPVTRELLRSWGLPDPGESKKARGDVVVVGGSRSAPGAAVLAGEAALRVGAGRVALVVPGSIDAHVGIALPEAGIAALPERADEPLTGDLRDRIRSADAVLVGPGFDDAEETRATLLAVAEAGPQRLILDAYALGVLPDVDRTRLPDELVLSPNREELEILLGRESEGDPADVREAARALRAVVGCYGVVAHPDGRAWLVDEGGSGLGTSGSGDVLAGAVAGFVARGLPIERGLVWAAWVHAVAGERLTDRVGLGFLARELSTELTPTMRDTLAAGA